MSAPQTPLLKSKLSLDIPSPSSHSVFNSPVLPSSPSLNPIPSPTLSGSWCVSKSQAELLALVKEAYNFIKEKERDLTLAAEIGKSLLENNIALKAKYETLLNQFQSLQRQQQKATTFALKAHAIEKPTAVPIAPPSNSLDPSMEYRSDFEESDDVDSINNGYASSIDVHPSTTSNNLVKRYNDSSGGDGVGGGSSSSSNNINNNVRKKASKKSHQKQPSLSNKDIEHINELESMNQDLQTRLDKYDETDKSNKAKMRKLEADLTYYQGALSQAVEKIEVLEKEIKRLTEKQTSDFWKIKYKKSENEEFIENLLNKVAELEEQNNYIERAKTEIERKLSRITEEKETIQEQFDELIDKCEDYEMLQLENKHQSELILDLTERLEQERSKVVSLAHSRNNSRSNSFSENTLNTLRRLSDPDRMKSLFESSLQTPTEPIPSSSKDSRGGMFGGLGGKIKRTLLSELENEWFRELTLFQRDRKKSLDYYGSPPFSPVLSEKDLSDYFLNNGSHAADNDDVSEIDYLPDDEFSFLDEFDTDNEKETKKREWFWRRWARNVYLFFRLIWKWIKFILILFAANIMAIYRGPDDILSDGDDM